jgi:protein-S-isoprenylcysteine O-methyltransferase Ste14
MNKSQSSQSELIKMVTVRFLFALPALIVIFFLPAWTFSFWHAWVYLGIILIPMGLVLTYMFKNEPDLLERRMKMKEPEKEQNLIVRLSLIPFLFAFLIPGFDFRFGWSNVPVPVVVIAEISVLLGYGIFFLVMRENRYASRVVQVEQDQTVINSGPYAIVRHPMYLGAVVMYLFSPLALGSYWALIPAAFIIPVFVARILNEEKVLMRDLKGYQEYMQKTRNRLIPGIW